MANLQDQIRQFCSEHSLKLNTNLGQHFLIDQAVLDAIIESGDIQPEDHVVEIGPGIGVLTRELLKRASKVTAIELDDRMIPLLKQYVEDPLKANRYKLTAINENALNAAMPRDTYKVIANIPYHITSPLLRHIYMESTGKPTSATLLIQKEVADRICDKDNTDLLSLSVKLFGTPQKIINVPPEAFLPPPKVDSAVIHIESYAEPLASNDVIDKIMQLAKIAFSQKRKMLSNSFRFPGGLELLSAVDIDKKRRPQTVSVQEWIALAKAAMQ
ncbi:MAG: ribosomal RNA small subunit methyltransferase A [Candidatus Peregrinibacteria bacterium]|nr:ribosomal RNA small subunit methyltransferase A [Candidatus Peregrinibacteria bacterium]